MAMKVTEFLFEEERSRSKGNHSSLKVNGVDDYYYYDTVIARVDHNQKTIIIDNGGYRTSSTTRAINDYIGMARDKYPSYSYVDKR